jgi:hypothetical protein
LAAVACPGHRRFCVTSPTNYFTHPSAIRQSGCRLPQVYQLGDKRQDENNNDDPDNIAYFHHH